MRTSPAPAAWHGRSGFSGRGAGVGSGILVGIVTGGWVAAPAAGRVIERIAPFLGVKRKTELVTIAAPTKNAAPEAGL